jgi:hypothetical protein
VHHSGFAGGAATRLATSHSEQPAPQVKYDEDIVFPINVFVGTKDYVQAKGTLVGDWIAYKNNAYSILSVPDECLVRHPQVVRINREFTETFGYIPSEAV